MTFSHTVSIAPAARKFYLRARIIMYIFIVIITLLFLHATLFPTVTFDLDFRRTGATRYPLINPRTEAGVPLLNGTIGANGSLVANLSVPDTFSRADARVAIEDDAEQTKSPVDLEVFPFSIRRSYLSFFYPIGENIEAQTTAQIYRIADTYYEVREDRLLPFVSEGAYLSRYPQEKAQMGDTTLLSQFPVAEEWLGYRPGSLLAFADGVFVVTSDREVRPIGSADIFLALGYKFEDVIAASAEEVGIYERGRIFVLGNAHPDGTLFLDQDTGIYYLIEKGFKRPIKNMEYLNFLKEKASPIVASSNALLETSTCSAGKMTFSKMYGCEADLALLSDNPGPDYEIIFKGSTTEIDLAEQTRVSMERAVNKENLVSLLSKVKNRVLSRFGYANIQ